MRRRGRVGAVGVAILAVALLGACTGQVEQQAPGAAGETVTLPTCTGTEDYTTPKNRIAVTEPSVLDTFAALGIADRVVARSGTSSVEDPENAPLFADVTSVGSSAPSTEGLVAAAPDLLVQGGSWHLDPAQGGADANAVRASGAQIYPTRGGCVNGFGVTEGDTLDGILDDITNLGALTGVPERAEELTGQLRAQRDQVIAQVAGQPRVRGLQVGVVGGELFATGAGLQAEMLDVAGMENVLPDPTQVYVPVSPEVITERNPEVIVMFTFPTEDPAAQLEYLRATFPATDAVRTGRIGTVESRKASAATPATFEGLAEIAHIVHPQAVPAPTG